MPWRFVLIVAVALLGGAKWSAHAAPDTGATGGTLFLRDCAICHGATGGGTDKGPSLRNVGRASIHYYVSTGRMPLLKTARADTAGRPRTAAPGRFPVDDDVKVTRRPSPYSPAEMGALIDYATTLTGSGVDVASIVRQRGDVPRGGELFRLNCAACHSWAGEGGALLQREAPDLKSTTKTQAAEAVRIGPGAMPVFGEAALDDKQVADVVAYVDYLQHADDPGGSALWHLGPVAEGAVALIAGLGALVAFIRWIGERG